MRKTRMVVRRGSLVSIDAETDRINAVKRSLFGRGDRPADPHDRRGACRYAAVKNHVFLGWWEDSVFQTTTGVMEDVSLSGASVVSEAPTPADHLIWISRFQVPPTEWVEASVVGAERIGRSGLFSRPRTRLRLKFFEACSYDFFKAVIEK